MSNDVEPYNIDEEIEATFQELFGENQHQEKVSEEQSSKLIEIIRKKREKTLMDSFFSTMEKSQIVRVLYSILKSSRSFLLKKQSIAENTFQYVTLRVIRH